MIHDNAAYNQDAVIDRYSGLARIAAAGGTPVDGDPDTFTDRCFGAAAYAGDTAGVPAAALRASLVGVSPGQGEHVGAGVQAVRQPARRDPAG